MQPKTNNFALNIQNCMMFQNRTPLSYVPKSFTYYFINSKRRFFLYLKSKEQMEQLVKIFDKENIKYYKRKSMFPDRQEQEQIIYHGNYKYKKKDLKKYLRHGNSLKQPRRRYLENQQILNLNISNRNAHSSQILPFLSFQASKNNIDIQQKVSSKSIQKHQEIMQQQTQPQFIADYGKIKIKSKEVFDIINNVDLIKALFKSQKKR